MIIYVCILCYGATRNSLCLFSCLDITISWCSEVLKVYSTDFCVAIVGHMFESQRLHLQFLVLSMSLKIYRLCKTSR